MFELVKAVDDVTVEVKIVEAIVLIVLSGGELYEKSFWSASWWDWGWELFDDKMGDTELGLERESDEAINGDDAVS